MYNPKVIAISAKEPNVFEAFLDSLSASSLALANFMYGTKERTRVTYFFACALFVMGMFMSSTATGGLAACPI